MAAPREPGRYPGVVFYTDIFQLTESTLRWCRRLAGHGFEVCGFPVGSDPGAWARGVLNQRRADDTVQIESPSTVSAKIVTGRVFQVAG